ncbi:MAG: hypothetical protein ACI81R_003009 [Bradymonadia bacterium]|jgi:hypothetical protein
MQSETTPTELFTGTWRNDNSSEMQLAVGADGAVSGSYRTGVGRPDSSDAFALAGFVNGDLIAFCVNFGDFASLTSWTGKYVVDGAGDPVIHTLWHLARETSAPGPTALWESLLAGASQFRRVG